MTPPGIWPHTSVVTILNIMVKKKYLRRTKSGAAYTFHPVIGREGRFPRACSTTLVDRVFDGSAAHVMVNLLERTDLSSEEIGRLRKLITRKAKEERP